MKTSKILSVSIPLTTLLGLHLQHPGWNRRTLQNDIALIKLISPVEMNQYVKTIEMHSAGTDLDGADCTISGWGVTTVGELHVTYLHSDDGR